MSAARLPAHSRDPGRYSGGLWALKGGTRTQGEGGQETRGGGKREAALTSRGAGAGRTGPQPPSPVSVTRRRGAGGSLQGPQGGGGADAGAGGQLSAARSHTQPAAASPRRHPRCRRLPRRPRPLPKRAPSRHEPLVGWERYLGACLPVLVLGSRLGTRAPHPGTARSSTPPVPAGRAEPRCAVSAHVRGCLAAPGSPVAEAPLELRALETPCSFGLHPSSSPAGPQGPGGLLQCPPRSALAREGSRGSELASAARAELLPGSGSPHPHSVALPITKLPWFPGSAT